MIDHMGLPYSSASGTSASKRRTGPNDRGFDHFHGFLGDMMDDYWTHLRGDKNWMQLTQPATEISRCFKYAL